MSKKCKPIENKVIRLERLLTDKDQVAKNQGTQIEKKVDQFEKSLKTQQLFTNYPGKI